MTHQPTLFDLPPTAPAAPGRAKRARAGKDTAPVPPAWPAAQEQRQAGQPELPETRRQTLREFTAKRVAEKRAHYRAEAAQRPGPALPAEILARLAVQGVTFAAAYLAADGDTSGAGTPLYALESERFSAALGSTILVKTREGVEGVLQKLEARHAAL